MSSPFRSIYPVEAAQHLVPFGLLRNFELQNEEIPDSRA